MPRALRWHSWQSPTRTVTRSCSGTLQALQAPHLYICQPSRGTLQSPHVHSKRLTRTSCTCKVWGHGPVCKSLRSSYTGLCPQIRPSSPRSSTSTAPYAIRCTPLSRILADVLASLETSQLRARRTPPGKNTCLNQYLTIEPRFDPLRMA